MRKTNFHDFYFEVIATAFSFKKYCGSPVNPGVYTYSFITLNKKKAAKRQNETDLINKKKRLLIL